MVKTVNDAEYGSDDEVYALANAVDAADPHYEEERLADRKAIDPLPPVDHANIVYDDFGKNFYEEPAELAAMTPDEVSFSHDVLSWERCFVLLVHLYSQALPVTHTAVLDTSWLHKSHVTKPAHVFQGKQ